MTTSTAGPNPNVLQRLFTRLMTTPFGTWLIVNIATRFDPLLLRVSGGRLHTGLLAGIWVGLLTTTGAKSGQPRSVPLLYVMDADRVVLIGSNVGRRHNPGWVYNVRAHPHVSMTIHGQRRNYLASEVESPERERLWAISESVYSGFRDYKRRAGRTIAVFVLQPEQE